MITTYEDDFIRSRYESFTRWIAYLDDGTKVYQDDGRPLETDQDENWKDVTIPAWLRLKTYCKINNRYIKQLILQFRDHFEPLPPNKDGYMFKFGAGAVWGGPTHQQYVVGYVENGRLYKFVYNIPELIIHSTKDLEVDPNDISLIMKP